MLKIHDVTGLLALVKIVAASQNTTKENLCQDLLTIENFSDLKVHALHYANEIVKNFCKLAKQTETIKNYQKQVLIIIKHCLNCLGNSQIKSIPEERVFFHNSSFTANAKAYGLKSRKAIRLLFIHSAKLKSRWRPWKLTFSMSSEHETTHLLWALRSAMSSCCRWSVGASRRTVLSMGRFRTANLVSAWFSS